ncbi:DUF7370 family protein [Pasteurella testudinis]|uniref:DUF7370 family protein n=1 Tax=Pasteurella testudinis TaxID=761 RepID=UPI000DFE2B69|nr:hypothetical protein [Pasteurella testudinis]SUB51633.1 Uncharacterised protein [Pasteurella testudinis]
MAKLNNSDVKQFISEHGYSVSDVVLELITVKVDSIDECMAAAGYDEATQALIKLYAVALMAASQGARKLKSQSAPSGAGRSFEYSEAGLKQLRGLLSSLDPHGCTASLPISINQVGFFDVVG